MENHFIVAPSQHQTLQHLIAGDQTVSFLIQSDAVLNLHLESSALPSNMIYHLFLEENSQALVTINILHGVSCSIAMHLHLDGAGSRADLFGLYALDGQENIHVQTFQMHEGENTQSHITIKGMAKDTARANIAGLIRIGPDAKKSDASQQNKNILCGTGAQVVSIPSIEVLQNDVQCCHGTATGQFDRKQLWYLQSKGLQQAQAHRLLIRSFFGPIVEKMNNSVMEMVCKKMA